MEQEITQLLSNRFGIDINELNVKFVEGKDKAYMCSNELAELLFRGVQRKGMIAFKLNTLFGTKPTLDFVLMYGHLATKNYIEFNDDEIKLMYSGKDIIKKINCDNGLVIIKKEEKGIGLVFKKEDVLISLIPKNRFTL